MIIDICAYSKQHPDEKILVYIGAHGDEDGSSGNGWTKEDWITISQYSNVKIISVRCYFGTAYSNENYQSGDYIYNQISSLSGFSNQTQTSASGLDGIFEQGFEKGLGFHEFEIYTRLHYDLPSPLTESFEYKDRITGEKKKKNVGLAYEKNGNVYDDNV